MTPVNDFLSLLVAQTGDRYRFGAETRFDDPDPDEFDCSELIQWAAARLQIVPQMPDGSWIQYQHAHKHGTVIPVAKALQTPGALLFMFGGDDPMSRARPSFAHVAVSLGDGRTMEARSRSLGVGVFGGATARKWTHAALVPGVQYEVPKPVPAPAPTWPGRYLKKRWPYMRGDDVRTVQRRLAHHGTRVGSIDGVFGPITDRAVRTFQSARRIEVDGVVGPVTWQALWN